MLDYARRAVRRAHELDTIVVGNNPKGVDIAVVRECRRLQTKVIVAGEGNFPHNGGCKYAHTSKSIEIHIEPQLDTCSIVILYEIAGW